MKKINNKGFTLVELIIVVAIIAVLAAVLAPQYLRYVERARQSNDLQIATSIIKATQVAMADPKSGIPSNRLVEVLWNTGPEVSPQSRLGTVLIRYPSTGGRNSVLKSTIPSLTSSDQTKEEQDHFNTMILEILGIAPEAYTDWGAGGYLGMMQKAQSTVGQSTSFVIHVDSTTGQVALASYPTAADSNVWIDEIGVNGVLRAP